MDSREVAQYLVSPAEAGSSHSRSVFSRASASGESDRTEKRLSMSVSLLEEKGMELATERGRKAALDEVLVKCRFILVPGRRSFSRKKTATLRLSWICRSPSSSSSSLYLRSHLCAPRLHWYAPIFSSRH
ncbi:unnamed protein product [Spirodela intermedia]|uniref:Uncharacterized protein n=1 Tax=Spirodela intermedia TaxID=51605 RepID=A0A7I8J6W0_SPIIN|nr:unnamed protein product [Spirodela intermedia]CAA6665967.1 unnamed protein product [Spirodela intermedia]